MRIAYRHFTSGMMPSDSHFAEAAKFASTLSPERLVSIGHSRPPLDIGGNGVVTVWYWQDEDDDR